MANETERKFLVKGEGWRPLVTGTREIVQAYLALYDTLEVRIRISDGTKASLTIKTGAAALSRSEYEYAIPLADAEALLAMRQGHAIRKRRHIVPRVDGNPWEIDIFEGEHVGLCIAEIELKDGDEGPTANDWPDWIGREVTGESAYYNSTLARRE